MLPRKNGARHATHQTYQSQRASKLACRCETGLLWQWRPKSVDPSAEPLNQGVRGFALFLVLRRLCTATSPLYERGQELDRFFFLWGLHHRVRTAEMERDLRVG